MFSSLDQEQLVLDKQQEAESGALRARQLVEIEDELDPRRPMLRFALARVLVSLSIRLDPEALKTAVADG
jgi:hypothetical protein